MTHFFRQSCIALVAGVLLTASAFGVDPEVYDYAHYSAEYNADDDLYYWIANDYAGDIITAFSEGTELNVAGRLTKSGFYPPADYDSGVGNNFFLSHLTPTTGNYMLSIWGETEDDEGAFDLWVYTVMGGIECDFDAAGPTSASALSLAIGGNQSEQICPVEDVDMYTITVTQSRTLKVYTTGTTDTSGWLTGPGVNAIDYDSGTGTNFLMTAAVSPGTYQLRVTSDSSEGDYQVYALYLTTQNPSPVQDTTLAYGTSKSLSLYLTGEYGLVNGTITGYNTTTLSSRPTSWSSGSGGLGHISGTSLYADQASGWLRLSLTAAGDSTHAPSSPDTVYVRLIPGYHNPAPVQDTTLVFGSSKDLNEYLTGEYGNATGSITGYSTSTSSTRPTSWSGGDGDKGHVVNYRLYADSGSGWLRLSITAAGNSYYGPSSPDTIYVRLTKASQNPSPVQDTTLAYGSNKDLNDYLDSDFGNATGSITGYSTSTSTSRPTSWSSGAGGRGHISSDSLFADSGGGWLRLSVTAAGDGNHVASSAETVYVRLITASQNPSPVQDTTLAYGSSEDLNVYLAGEFGNATGSITGYSTSTSTSRPTSWSSGDGGRGHISSDSLYADFGSGWLRLSITAAGDGNHSASSADTVYVRLTKVGQNPSPVQDTTLAYGSNEDLNAYLAGEFGNATGSITGYSTSTSTTRPSTWSSGAGGQGHVSGDRLYSDSGGGWLRLSITAVGDADHVASSADTVFVRLTKGPQNPSPVQDTTLAYGSSEDLNAYLDGEFGNATGSITGYSTSTSTSRPSSWSSGADGRGHISSDSLYADSGSGWLRLSLTAAGDGNYAASSADTVYVRLIKVSQNPSPAQDTTLAYGSNKDLNDYLDSDFGNATGSITGYSTSTASSRPTSWSSGDGDRGHISSDSLYADSGSGWLRLSLTAAGDGNHNASSADTVYVRLIKASQNPSPVQDTTLAYGSNEDLNAYLDGEFGNATGSITGYNASASSTRPSSWSSGSDGRGHISGDRLYADHEFGWLRLSITAAGDANHAASSADTVYVRLVETDTDGDGISDYEEEYNLGTEPDNPDSDGDGLNDGFEVFNGYDPLDASDVSDDVDGDLLTGPVEALAGANGIDGFSDPTGWNENTALNNAFSSYTNGSAGLVLVLPNGAVWGVVLPSMAAQPLSF